MKKPYKKTNKVPAIMLQGTGSNVGKSLLVAGLCRAFAQEGLKVAPFKPQNMSNNAAVTIDGGEIGRAQALQAKAAYLDSLIDMNPVLLKPESEQGAQIILQGKPYKVLNARDYGQEKASLLPAVLESYHRLSKGKDLMIIEGAGSPAEVNLRDGDIANMGFAEAINCPVILVGDIDRGGVIASMVGSFHVLSPDDRALVKGFIINRFRGNMDLFTDGMRFIAQETGWKSMGIVPWFDQASILPAEDGQDLRQKYKAKQKASIRIAVPILPRMANFDDLDPLMQNDECEIILVEPNHPIPQDCAIILLPGSKNTKSDCEFLINQGWDIDIKAHHRQGGIVIGLCGGYQILGQWIHDPEGFEGKAGSVAGLGLLNIETILEGTKTTRLAKATCMVTQEPVQGYEIHTGKTTGIDCRRPWLQFSDGGKGDIEAYDGAISQDGRVFGSYLHGIFNHAPFKQAFFNKIGLKHNIIHAQNYDDIIDNVLNQLASHLSQSIDLKQIFYLANI